MRAILLGPHRVLGGMSSRRWASVRLIGMLVALAALLAVVQSDHPHADVAHAQTDNTAPALDGTPYIEANVVVITYDEALDEDSIPGNDAYTVTINGSEVEIDEGRIDGRVVNVIIISIVHEGETVLLSYTKGTDPVQDTIRERRRRSGRGDSGEPRGPSAEPAGADRHAVCETGTNWSSPTTRILTRIPTRPRARSPSESTVHPSGSLG